MKPIETAIWTILITLGVLLDIAAFTYLMYILAQEH